MLIDVTGNHPIHTILGYSQWIVTWVIELELAPVHITTQHVC